MWPVRTPNQLLRDLPSEKLNQLLYVIVPASRELGRTVECRDFDVNFPLLRQGDERCEARLRREMRGAVRKRSEPLHSTLVVGDDREREVADSVTDI